MADPSTADELAALRAEVERLQGLVGPSEVSYEELSQDVVEASAIARRAELETGELRGQVVELQSEIARRPLPGGPETADRTTSMRSVVGRVLRPIRARFS